MAGAVVRSRYPTPGPGRRRLSLTTAKVSSESHAEGSPRDLNAPNATTAQSAIGRTTARKISLPQCFRPHVPKPEVRTVVFAVEHLIREGTEGPGWVAWGSA